MEKINYVVPIIWLTGIFLSLFAIFKIVGNAELAIGLIIISFGILSVIWSSIAHKSLSAGSQLKRLAGIFLYTSISVFVYAIWSILDSLFHWKGFMVYFGYMFLTMTFFLFVFAAYQILTIGKEFGFKIQADKIKKVMAEKKSKPKKSS